jgi:hypothetical protein
MVNEVSFHWVGWSSGWNPSEENSVCASKIGFSTNKQTNKQK